jgi:predicted RNase H-like nuclease
VLGRARSALPAPVRAALETTDYRDASGASRAQGKRLSNRRTTIPKIREIDHALRAGEHADERVAARVHEVHPELSFLLLNDGAPMSFAKKRAEGRAAPRLSSASSPAHRRDPRAVSQEEMQDDDIRRARVAERGRIATGRADDPRRPATVRPARLPMTIQA